MNLVQEQIWNKGYNARYQGESRHAAIGLYKRKYNRQFWVAGWEQAEAEIVAADFSNRRNHYSLINPKNPFFGKAPLEL